MNDFLIEASVGVFVLSVRFESLLPRRQNLSKSPPLKRTGALGIGGDMDSVFTAVTRREYVPVGSDAASMPRTVTPVNTEFMSLAFPG